MSSRGFPGRRVAAMRAGISTKVRLLVIGVEGRSGGRFDEEMTGVLKDSPVYTGCQKAGKPLSQRRYLCGAARLLQVAFQWPFPRLRISKFRPGA